MQLDETIELKQQRRKDKLTPVVRAPQRPLFFVGIDLGTSRTAVAASNGERRECLSYLGIPRDAIAEKLLGKRLLFGQEALDHRMAVTLCRPMAQGVIDTSCGSLENNVDAVSALIEHVVGLVSPPAMDAICGVIGAPAGASVENKNLILEVSREILDAAVVISEPFAVGYGAGILDDALIIDIGAGTMDLCRMHGTFPSDEDQVTIGKGGDFIDRALYDALTSRYPDAQLTINMVKRIKERYASVADDVGEVEVELAVNGRPKKFEITEELRLSCTEIVPDLLAAMHSLIGSFDPEFQARLRSNVVLCGGGSRIRGLQALVEKSLEALGGGKVSVVDDPLFAGADGALRIARELPGEFWSQLGHTAGARRAAT